MIQCIAVLALFLSSFFGSGVNLVNCWHVGVGKVTSPSQKSILHERETDSVRRETIIASSSIIAGILLKPSSPALATTGSIKTSQFASRGKSVSKTTNNPQEAFSNIIKAKDEMLVAQGILSKAIKSDDIDKVDQLKVYLESEAINMNNFEGNALALLQSKVLSEDTRKEIGTIRRYGVGADVQIMYGGLISELDASEYPDMKEAEKYLKRTIDSLSEVIVLCESDGL